MPKKHAYITTAIPYVNGEPHIGHAIDYLLADVWARYQRQLGKVVRFQTGVDEHGNKISAKALEQGLTPQAYAEALSGQIGRSAALVGGCADRPLANPDNPSSDHQRTLVMAG